MLHPLDLDNRLVRRKSCAFRPRRGNTRSTVGTEVPVETWTYNRGPNQLMVSIRFVDGKVVAIDTLHEYGH